MAKKKHIAYNGLSEALSLPNYDNSFNWGGVNPTVNAFGIPNNITQVLLTLQPYLLAYAYKTYGIFQTVVDQPVDDAFRGGVELKSETLDTEDLETLKQAMEDGGDWEEIMYTLKWSRLFGGGVLVANTPQDSKTPLNERGLKNKPLEFYASDRWQCIATDPDAGAKNTNFIMEDLLIDKTRTKIEVGKRPPYYVRLRLQGWGLSIYEALLPALIQYFKSQNVMLELLDEKKIDVLKIFGLAETLASPGGTAKIKKRVDIAAANKNFRGMLTMADKDDYQQKELTMAGMADMSKEIRIMIASAVKMPVSKIWGVGSSGFSSGEDDLENYNSIVEGEIRIPAEKLIKWVVDLRCMQLFGFKIPDLKIAWKPLRVLSAREMQEIENWKVNNAMQMFDRGLLKASETMTYLKQEDIILIKTEAEKGGMDDFNPMKDDYTKVEDITF